MNFRILLVEDDYPTRERLARLIRDQPGLELQAAVDSCASARTALNEQTPDALLVDLGLPDGNGTEVIRHANRLRVQARSAGVRPTESAPLCMVVTAFGDEAHVIDAIMAGACAYVLKDASEREIAQAIVDMRAGGSPISAAVARHVLDHYRERPPAGQSASPDDQSSASGFNVPELTGREREVLNLVAKGYTYQEIAESLMISINTVRQYIRSIYRKLAVGSRGEAVFEAHALGLIGGPRP